jgi:hypothetical protein
MLTPEQIMAKLYELRKEYQDDDDPDNEEYQTLHHAFLFLSYQMEAFKRYVQEAQKAEDRKG